MSASALVDADARAAALTSLQDSICVEAGAGTGKTTVLVNRMVGLVKNRGARMGQIAAITFTDKAAGELRQRLRDQFEQELAEARAGGDRALESALATAQRELGTAMIGTIHSFASSILREFPAEAGVDLAFVQLDEIGRSELIEDAWETWLQDLLQQDVPVLADFLYLGGKLAGLKSLALHLCASQHVHLAVPDAAEPIEPAWLAFLEHLGLLASVASECSDPADMAYVACSQFAALGEQLRRYEGIERWRELAESMPKVRARSGKRGNWRSAESLEACRAALALCAEAAAAVVASAKQDILKGLGAVAGGFASFYTGLKADRGLVDFDDLLILARDLVRDDLDVRAKLQKKFAYILVDEFQDTDALQAEVVFLLAADTPTATSWKEVSLSPGKLFIVGDPKQSIYRFRGADIEVYEHAKRAFSHQGQNLSIVQNFRTVSPIVEWVNETFGGLIVKPAVGNFQPAYESLIPVPNRCLDSEARRVWVLGSPDDLESDRDSGRIKIGEVRRAEAEAIAATIWDLVECGAGAEVNPDGFRFGDFAILFPNRSEIEVYEKALTELAIPYALDGGRSYYARQEVDYLISVLKALVNPRDEIAVIASLRSPHFGIPDDVILAHRIGGGTFDYRRPGFPTGSVAADGLQRALETLGALHELRFRTSMGRLVELVLDETKAIEVLMARRSGRQAAHNLLKICDMARAYERSGSATLSAFVDWLGDRRGSQTAEAESATSELTDDVVQLMTIHKSKGLEFPAVFMANLGGGAHRPRTFAPRPDLGTLELKLGNASDGFSTRGFAEADQYESEREAAEEIRLLYVAATRARDLLIIPNFSRVAGSKLECLKHYLEPVPVYVPGPAPITAAGRERAPEPRYDLGHLVRMRAEWASALRDLRRDASSPRQVIRPSRHQVGAKTELPDAATMERAKPAPTGGGALLGVAFHSAISEVHLAGAQPLRLTAESVCARLGCAELADSVSTLLAQCTTMPEYLELASAARVSCEVPFSVRVEGAAAKGTLCEGFMDAVWEHTDGTITVVDYKTDAVDVGEVDLRFESYRSQGVAYGAAIETLMPGRLRRVLFLFIRPQVARSLSNQHIKDAMQGVAWQEYPGS